MSRRPAGGLGRAAARLASGTVVSRMLGFVNALVLAQTLGSVGLGVDAFSLANQLPNNIFQIVAGGLMSAVLVPQIVKAGLASDGGQAFVNKLVTLGTTVFLGVGAVATLAAPLIVALYSQLSPGSADRGFGADQLALATAFAYWCLPQVFFYAVYSLVGEVLNARGVFGPFTWAPVVNNIVAIAGLLLFGALFGTGLGQATADTWQPEMIAVLAGTATLGVALQAITLLFFWRRTGLGFRPDFRWRGVGLAATGRAASWTFGMVLVNQLAGIVQVNVAIRASGDDPSVRALAVTWLIVILPHSIVTLSIVTAFYPRISLHARDGDLPSLRRDLSTTVRTVAVVLVFASAGLIALAYPFSAVFTQRPAANFGEVAAVAWVLIAYLAGLVPFSILFVLQRTFYALDEPRIPFWSQVFQSTLFVLGAILVSMQPSSSIAVGIALVTSLASLAQLGFVALILRRRIGGLDGRRLLVTIGRSLVAAVPAFAAGLAAVWALGAFEPGGFAVSGVGPAALAILAAGTVMGLVYLGGLVALRSPELRELAAPILGRRGR